MENPVRIYVLHHPASELARDLTEYIYGWFRLRNLEGVPVYLRSEPAPGKDLPFLPFGGKGVLEYLIPLVDANLVRDVKWHEYLLELAEKCVKPSNEDPPSEGWVMFPVALDGTAFNLPAKVGQRNFIRHPALPVNGVSEEQKKTAIESAAQETLKHLTEALSRDLNGRLFPKQAGQKLKIFISYARADGTEAPKALRDYIQGQTQCTAFFDENDISFGESFSDALEEGAGERARALIVVFGDHYADRPWCRWEISTFLRPSRVPLKSSDGEGRAVEMFHPVLVLDAMDASRISRVIPELGQAPVMRWAPGRELQAFSILIREVFFGARNVLAARSVERSRNSGLGPVVNRLPGPVILQRLLNEAREEREDNGKHIWVSYPGNGLPLMELRLIESLFTDVRLAAFRDVLLRVPKPMKDALAKNDRALSRKALAISFAVPPGLGAFGYLGQHLEEAVIYLLRPLLRLGTDLVYGGLAPKRDNSQTSEPLGMRNMTLTLMNLLNDERGADEVGGGEGGQVAPNVPRSRLYNMSPWPVYDLISVEDEAAWINTCSIVRVLPEDAGLTGRAPAEAKEPQRYLLYRAVVLSQMRRLLANGFVRQAPGEAVRRIQPAAFILLGGKLAGFYGAMPGIMEEFLRAVQHQLPVYVLGGLGGAAGAIARALGSNGRARLPEFTAAFYTNSATPKYRMLLNAFRTVGKGRFQPPEDAFDELWKTVRENRGEGIPELLRNGLSLNENLKLLETTDTMQAVHLVWQGLSKLFFDSK
jgi:hypothetical protein